MKLEVDSVILVVEMQLLVVCFYVICSVLVVSCVCEFCVKCQHNVGFVLFTWLEFTTYVLTVCELWILWRKLNGVKGKLDAFLYLSSHGGECSSKSLVLGIYFPPNRIMNCRGFCVLISTENKRVYEQQEYRDNPEFTQP